MQDTELFLSLAEIAGVFVGFGALIAVRSGVTADAYEVAIVGMVASYGVGVVATALAPVVIGRLGVTGHPLWLTCSVIVLVLFYLGDGVLLRMSPERRALLAATPRKNRVRYESVGLFLWVPMTIALVLVVLGVLPDLEPALYLAALVLLLLLVAFMLLMLVYRVGRPAQMDAPTTAVSSEPDREPSAT